MNAIHKGYFVLVLALLLLMSACTPEPEPIHVGHDQCVHCKMTISHEQYGAELVTQKGKVYKFDSVECLAAHQVAGKVATEDVHSLWVVDFHNPPTLLPVDDAFFLHSSNLHSPMGLNVTAFGPGIGQETVLDSFAGELLDWQQVLDLVRARQDENGALHPARHDTTREIQ